MKKITIIIEDKLGTILSSKSLCDSSFEIIRNNDNELTVTIKSDEFLITDWRTDVLPSTHIQLPSDEEIQQEANKKYQEQQQSYENSVEMFPINFANYLEVGFMDGMKWMRDKIKGGNK